MQPGMKVKLNNQSKAKESAMLPLKEPTMLPADDSIPLDMKEVNIHYLQHKFNFHTAALNSDSAYQYVYHEHPVAVMSANSNDELDWHQSGVFVDLDPKYSKLKVQIGGERQTKNYIANRNTYRYLLLIHAFTLSSPEFAFRDDEVTKLMEIYFFKINSIFPMVHEKRFWDDYSANRPISSLVYAIILAVLRDKMAEPILKEVFLRSKNLMQGITRTLLEYPENEFLQDFNFFLDELEVKIRQINLILPKLGDVDKLTKLVVQLLLATHYRTDRLGNEQNSQDLTAALNLAVSLGIHMKQAVKPMSKESLDHSTNLWWCCFIFDRFNAMTNSRCLFVSHDDFNIDLPYSNMNLLKMVQLARMIENMLLAVYRPFDNSHMENLNNEFTARMEIFNLDEFRIFEFQFCDKEIASGSPMTLSSPEAYPSKSNLDSYVSDTVRLMDRVINNMVILVSQKMKFNNPAIDNLIPRKDIMKAGANVLWYISHIDERLMINIPILIWALSISMAAYLKVRAMGVLYKKTQSILEGIVPRYEVNDFMDEIRKYKSKWWMVEDIFNSTTDLITKLELSSKKTEHEDDFPEPKRQRHSTELETSKVESSSLSRKLSIPSIQSIIHGPDNPQTPSDLFNIEGSVNNEYEKLFEFLHVDIFDNEFFKDVPNIMNNL